MGISRKRLNDDEKRLAVEMLIRGANDKNARKKIATYFSIDPTVVDKIRSGANANPKFLDEKWRHLSDEQRSDLVNRMEKGELSLTDICNGWCTSPATIYDFMGHKKDKTIEPININLEIEIETFKKIVKNVKHAFEKKYGEFTDCIIKKIVEETLNENKE